MARQEHRCDDGHIGQMRAAVVGVVQDKHIAGLHLARVVADHGLDALAHRAQMHRHVRRVGNQMALGIEQGARKIQTLFDVHRVSGVLQLQTHLLGDIHEQVVEHFQEHRVHRGTCCMAHLACVRALQKQMVECSHLGLPTRLNHRGGVLLSDHRRAVDAVARLQVFTGHQTGFVPARDTVQTRGEHAHLGAHWHLARGVQCVRGLV